MIAFDGDNVFLVTGAGSGIGRAIALRLVGLGAVVLGVGRNEERLAETKALAADPARFHALVRDLGHDVDALPEWVRETSAKHGALRGLVHAAAQYDVMPLRVLSMPYAREVFEVNFFAGLALAKGFCRKGVYAPGGSSVVFISSVSSVRGYNAVAAYAASKGAINAAVRSLARENARLGVRFNAVLPGVTDTDMLKKTAPEEVEYLVAQQPLGMGRPEDTADACAFLLSSASRMITGQCIGVDGGATL